MAQGHILEGNGRRPDENGAEEGSRDRPRRSVGHPGISKALSRDFSGSAVQVVREVQAGQADGVLDRDRGAGGRLSDVGHGASSRKYDGEAWWIRTTDSLLKSLSRG
jgi:hypothetical protein